MKRVESRVPESDVRQLIELAYDAPLASTGWDPFLSRLADVTRSALAGFLTYDRRDCSGDVFSIVGANPAFVAEYSAWVGKNVLVTTIADRLATGLIVRNTPVSRHEWLACDFYNEFMRRYARVRDNMGVVLVRTDATFAYVCTMREANRPDYGPREWELYEALRPHLQRSVAIQRRLRALELWRTAAEDVLDRLPAAVFFLARDGTVLLFNAEARRLLDAGGGLSLDRDGRLRAGRDTDTRRLQRVVAATCASGSGNRGGTFLVSRVTGRPYGVVVSPVGKAGLPLASPTPAAVVVVSDPDRNVDLAGVLARVYGLTSAEARLANLLVAGRTLDDAATVLGVTRNTARWTLKQVFAKTGACRQAELVRLLVAGPAGFAGGG